MENWQDYYQALGVDPDANGEEIKDAFHYKCQTAHPDKVAEKYKQRATTEFKQIKEAYEVLNDPEKRRQYHEEWLQRVGKAPTSEAPKPRPVVTPPSIRFSDVSAGEVERGSFIVQNEGGPYKHIWFSDPDSWVRISNYQSVDPSDELPLQIEIEAVGEEWGKHYVEQITVRLDDQETRVKIEFQTMARPTAAPPCSGTATRPTAGSATKPTAGVRVTRPSPPLGWLAKGLIAMGVILLIAVVGGRWMLPPPVRLEGDQRYLAISNVGGIIALADFGSIYVLSQGRRTIVSSKESNYAKDPAWSPDGSCLAFVKSDSIYIYHLLQGYSERVPIPDDLRCQFPAWSPCGKKLAFVGNSSIYVLDLDNGNLDRITDDNAFMESPAWSPNGTKISFVKAHGENKEIYVMDKDGSNQQRLTSNRVSDESPCWSPSGTKIAFARWEQSAKCGNMDIWVMNSDGSNQQRLTNDAQTQRLIEEEYRTSCPGEDDPVWSADGQSIYFVESSTGPLRIFAMNTDGSNLRRLYQLEL